MKNLIEIELKLPIRITVPSEWIDATRREIRRHPDFALRRISRLVAARLGLDDEDLAFDTMLPDSIRLTSTGEILEA